MQRRMRLIKLLSLREKQHAIAVAALYSARQAFETSVQSEVIRAGRAKDALSEQADALRSDDRHKWMLSCFAYELERVQIVQRRSERLGLQTLLASAENNELDSRRELEQTKTLLKRIERDDDDRATCVEQKVLDEAALILRSRSSAREQCWQTSHKYQSASGVSHA